jgi:ABC-type multidrug transport system ATPase subunit
MEEITIIEAHDLRRSFNGFEAVVGVCFEVERGEIFVLLGPNGAGKTTIIRLRPVKLTLVEGSLEWQAVMWSRTASG